MGSQDLAGAGFRVPRQRKLVFCLSMDILFFLLTITSLFLLIIGVIKPFAFTRFTKKVPTRKQMALVFGGLTFLLFVGFVIAIGASQENQISDIPPPIPGNEQSTKIEQNPPQPIAPPPPPQKPSVPSQPPKASSQPLYYPVVSVTDGDTFKVNINGKIETVRAIGIDTPETVDPRKPVECFGKEASNKAKALLTNKSIKLEPDPTQGDRDKYGRFLRYAWLEDGTFFNKQMIADGYASEYTYKVPYKYQQEFKAAEAQAKAVKVGLWADDACVTTNQTPPPATQPGSHTFYTSSHWSAEFYYCDTDDGWKGLSPKYLKSFPSAEALLQSYPDRMLHEPCQ